MQASAYETMVSVDHWNVDVTTGHLSHQEGRGRLECAFELGDWLSMVSAGTQQLAATHRVLSTTATGNEFQAQHRITLNGGTALISQFEQVNGRSIERQFRLTPADTLTLGDFVVRFVFVGDEIDYVRIHEESFEHRGMNRYLQYDADVVELVGPETRTEVSIKEATVPTGLDVCMYVRDEPPNKWVVHVRVIATDGNGLLRLYNMPWKHLSMLDTTLQYVGPLRDRLRYIRERSAIPGRLLPLQYVHTTELSEGDEVFLDVALEKYQNTSDE